MIQVGSRAELRCHTPEGHEAIYDMCDIVSMSSKTIEVRYCSKVVLENNKISPVIRRDIISRDRIIYLKELC